MNAMKTFPIWSKALSLAALVLCIPMAKADTGLPAKIADFLKLDPSEVMASTEKKYRETPSIERSFRRDAELVAAAEYEYSEELERRVSAALRDKQTFDESRVVELDKWGGATERILDNLKGTKASPSLTEALGKFLLNEPTQDYQEAYYGSYCCRYIPLKGRILRSVNAPPTHLPEIIVSKTDTEFWNSVKTLADPEYVFVGEDARWLAKQNQKWLKNEASKLLKREGML